MISIRRRNRTISYDTDIVPSHLNATVMRNTTGLLDLPAEILPLVTAHLEYPDVLSLRLVHPYLYYSPLLNIDNDAGIKSRVAWLCSLAFSSPGPLQALKGPSPSLALALHMPYRVPRWLLSGPTPHAWRQEETLGNTVQSKTNAEFLSSRQVQKLLKSRIDHLYCKDKSCRVVPGGTCTGPKKSCRVSLLVCRQPVASSLQSLAASLRAFNSRCILSGWDLLFVFLISVALIMPWCTLIQGLGRLAGREIGLHTAGAMVMMTGFMVCKSQLNQSKAYCK
jgi:hypothetical protein